MPNQPYFPNREGDQLTFFTNLQTKIPAYYTALDISAPRQAKLSIVLSWLTWTWQTYLPSRRNDGPAATAWRNSLASGTNDASVNAAPPVPATLTPPASTPFFGMLTWLFEEVGRWKTAEGYTDAVGEALAIVGAGGGVHANPPDLNSEVTGTNTVRLTFALYEHSGVWFESLRQGDSSFSHIATDTSSPYEDTRELKTPGQAEWRDYRACWWDDSTASHNFGPTIRVAVGG